MAYKIRSHPLIPDDLVNALGYYESISPTLANHFRENVNRRIENIAEHPESFPLDISPVRFAKIDRFPYLIFFVVNKEFVSIIAIIHGASEPGRWRDRE